MSASSSALRQAVAFAKVFVSEANAEMETGNSCVNEAKNNLAAALEHLSMESPGRPCKCGHESFWHWGTKGKGKCPALRCGCQGFQS